MEQSDKLSRIQWKPSEIGETDHVSIETSARAVTPHEHEVPDAEKPSPPAPWDPEGVLKRAIQSGTCSFLPENLIDLRKFNENKTISAALPTDFHPGDIVRVELSLIFIPSRESRGGVGPQFRMKILPRRLLLLDASLSKVSTCLS